MRIRIAPLLLLLPLAGCAAPESGDGLTGIAGVPMLGLPPQAGRVVGVTERRSDGATTQTIALEADPSTPGQNQLVVTSHRRGPARRIRSDEIAAEMAAAMPGVPMAVAMTTNQNGLGPFGYAMGRGQGQTCLYGWQETGGPDPGAGTFDAPRRPMSVRLRICRTKTSPQALLAVMQGLGAGGFAAGGAAMAQNDALTAAVTPGMAGLATPLLTQPAMASALPIPEDEPATARPRRRAAAIAAAPAPDPAAPAVVAPAAPAVVAPVAPAVAAPSVTVPLPGAPPAPAATPSPVRAAAPVPYPAPSAVPPVATPVPAAAPAAPLPSMPIVPMPN
jgi:hypothetical protein